jgi:hypothetical protein
MAPQSRRGWELQKNKIKPSIKRYKAFFLIIQKIPFIALSKSFKMNKKLRKLEASKV